MNVTVVTRLAVLFSVLFMGGALLATFVPAEHRNGPCGTWYDPEWKQPESDEMIEALAALSPARAADIAEQVEACDDAVDQRRFLSIVLAGIAFLIPVVAIIVTPGSKPREP